MEKPDKQMNEYETIIIGGGVAGLACAHRLNERGKDFLLLTKNIGGRINTSKDGQINYGALWIPSFYKHINRFATPVHNTRGLSLYFNGKQVSLFIPIFRYPWQFLKTLLLTIRFFVAYKRFQQRSEHLSQKEAIERDPYLRKLYFQPAGQFIKQHRIEDFSRTLIEPIMWGALVTRTGEQTAFYFMIACLPLIVRGWGFVFNKEALVKNFKDCIKIDEVTGLSENSTKYIVQTAQGHTFSATNMVVATEPVVAQKLLKLPSIKTGRDIYIFHVKATIKKQFQSGMIKFFGYDDLIFCIAEQADRTYVVHGLTDSVNLNKYFEQWETIVIKTWRPGWTAIGNILLDSKQGKRIWMIGDHNVVGLESSFITGLYAANQIA